jgi:hypothetical protein
VEAEECKGRRPPPFMDHMVYSGSQSTSAGEIRAKSELTVYSTYPELL